MISFASASQITRTSHDLLEWPWQQRNFTPSGDNVLCKQSVDMSHMRRVRDRLRVRLGLGLRLGLGFGLG